MKKILVLSFVILLILSVNLLAENPKKPLKSAALSLIIPGGGQFYNESYLKFGFVLALEGSLIGLTAYHHFKSEDYYDKYLATGDEKYYDKYSDYYYKRQNDFWWLGSTVLLSMIDAYVDAHLYNFSSEKKRIRLKFEDQSLLVSFIF
ncbi:MAG: hypothetical protein JW784_04200 [Candidatus Cloacimonetes bacterium]|nr:hypothetical protein [Candidatus Cloacimonadota bacterium]